MYYTDMDNVGGSITKDGTLILDKHIHGGAITESTWKLWNDEIEIGQMFNDLMR